MNDIKIEIQNARIEFTKLINEQVKPMRIKLDGLLQDEAKRLCPFSIGDIITLGSGRKGKITKIDYHSLDYSFQLVDQFLSNTNDIDKDYIFDYDVDDRKFSITWKISGLRMINNNTEVGKLAFGDISPDRFNIDVPNKTVITRPLREFIKDQNFVSDFPDIK